MDSWKKLQYDIKALQKHFTTTEINEPFYGLGCLNARICFIGERPGYQTRQKNGITFCGNRSGDFFLDQCAKFGFNFGNSYFTNLVKFQAAENETPTPAERALFKNIMKRELELLDPSIVVLVGRIAADFFIEDRPGLFEMEWYHINKRKFFTIPHPAYILRSEGQNVYDKMFTNIAAEYLALKPEEHRMWKEMGLMRWLA